MSNTFIFFNTKVINNTGIWKGALAATHIFTYMYSSVKPLTLERSFNDLCQDI